MKYGYLLLLLATTTVFSPPGFADDDANRAKAFLTARCFHCHGDSGAAEGGFDFVLNVGKMIERRKLTPGDVKASHVIDLIRSGKMPQNEEKLPDNEIAV